MKRVVSFLIALMMVSTVAFGTSYEIKDNSFDRFNDEILISYSGHNNENMTIFVYEVPAGSTKDTVWTEQNDVIGIDQAEGNGSFTVKVKDDFTGYVVVALGGELGDSTKVLLKIENGIPESITDAVYDAKGDRADVGEGKKITIQKGNKLLNATVSTSGTGVVEYTNSDDKTVSLTGDISFDGNGLIDAVEGKSVEIKIDNGETYNIGFIKKATVTEENTKCIFTVTSGDKSATKEFELNQLSGTIRLRAGVSGIPTGESVTQSVEIQ